MVWEDIQYNSEAVILVLFDVTSRCSSLLTCLPHISFPLLYLSCNHLLSSLTWLITGTTVNLTPELNNFLLQQHSNLLIWFGKKAGGGGTWIMSQPRLAVFSCCESQAWGCRNTSLCIIDSTNAHTNTLSLTHSMRMLTWWPWLTPVSQYNHEYIDIQHANQVRL